MGKCMEVFFFWGCLGNVLKLVASHRILHVRKTLGIQAHLLRMVSWNLNTSRNPYLGYLLTMVINHFLSGMILQVGFQEFCHLG